MPEIVGYREPLCVNFVRTGCPYCRAGHEIINQGFLLNYLRLHKNLFMIEINKDYGSFRIWWEKVSKNMIGKKLGTPAWVFFENNLRIFGKPKMVFLLTRKATGYTIRNFKDELLTLKDSMEEFLWREYPSFMTVREELTNFEMEEYRYAII